MCRVLRLIVMCLVALSVPVQGAAAISMLYCAPGCEHHAISSSLPTHDASSGDTNSHHDSSAADEAATAPDHTTHPCAGHDDGDASPNAKPSCGACVHCGCAAAALPASTIAVPDTIFVAVHGPGLAPAPVSFITAGPDRPPRATSLETPTVA